MPNVDGKKFPYSKAGKAAAKKEMLKKMVSMHGKKMPKEGMKEEMGEKKYPFLKKFAKK